MKTCKSKGFISLILLMTIAWSCENVKEYTDPTDNVPPGKVTDVEVENLHGGALITYTPPADRDLLGVKAVYTLREGGQVYEVFSSAHRDTIILAGFPDTDEHTVNLYAIDLSRNVSEPVVVTVKPLTPPVELIRQSLKVNITFGGLHCQWENVMEENIAISLYVDSIGEMVLDDTYYSKSLKGGYSFRGFPNKDLSFRIEIRDRWLNYSVPLDTVLTPMFEQQITGRDESGQQQWFIWGFDSRECLSRGDNGDTPENPPRDLMRACDGILFDAGNYYACGSNFGMLKQHVPGWTDETYAYPAYWSLDMSKEANYSRFKVYARNLPPFGPVFTVFELWGTNNPKPLVPELTDEDRLTNLRYWTSWAEIEGTDAWKNDWELLGDYSLVLPSGATMNTDVITSEDAVFIQNGFDYEITPDKTVNSYRYLRFVLKKSSWAGARQYVHFGELQFFGSYAN